LGDEQWPNETKEQLILAPHISDKPLVLSQTDCISPQWDYDVFSQKQATPDRYHQLSNNPLVYV
jgi:hypothetical protein